MENTETQETVQEERAVTAEDIDNLSGDEFAAYIEAMRSGGDYAIPHTETSSDDNTSDSEDGDNENTADDTADENNSS
ncbi:MAG: hypothetical protein ACI4DP_11530, partial [Candidatus Ornithomonoglobus sp.]